MKYLGRAIGFVALTAGAANDMPASAPPTDNSSVVAGTSRFVDTALFWREVSGPHGERDPAALPLYEAVFAHDKLRVASLLGEGASPNALLYPKGWSPLMVAIAYNDLAIVKELTSRGADINYVSRDVATGTPLAVAISYGRFYPHEKPNFEIFRYLLDRGADINAEFHGGDIATFAVTVGQFSLLSEVLERGYRRDLSRIERLLKIVRVDEASQSARNKALSAVERLMVP